MAEAVRVEGLAKLRRDLRDMPRESRREFQKALKEGAQVVARASGPFAARSTGRLAASFRAGTSGNAAIVRSRLPYAAVHEFGGTIRPRGVPIEIRPTPAATRALALNEDRIVDALGDAFDAVATRNGWH